PLIKIREEIPFAVVTAKSPRKLYRTLRSLFNASGSSQTKLLLVIDGIQEEVVALAQVLKVPFVVHTPQGRPGSNVRPNTNVRFALESVFDVFPNCDKAVILEDDLIVSPDIIRYFQETSWLLDADPTILAVNAFSYNSVSGVAADTGALKRVEAYPYYGWMVSRDVARQVVKNWMNDEEGDWDKWMLRDNRTRQGRDVVVPEVSRTYHDGGLGVHELTTATDVHRRAQTCTDVHRRAQTCTDVHKRAQTCTDVHRRAQTCTDVHRRAQTCTDVHRRAQTCTDVHRRAQTCTDVHRRAQTCTDVHRRSLPPKMSKTYILNIAHFSRPLISQHVDVTSLSRPVRLLLGEYVRDLEAELRRARPVVVDVLTNVLPEHGSGPFVTYVSASSFLDEALSFTTIMMVDLGGAPDRLPTQQSMTTACFPQSIGTYYFDTHEIFRGVMTFNLQGRRLYVVGCPLSRLYCHDRVPVVVLNPEAIAMMSDRINRLENSIVRPFIQTRVRTTILDREVSLDNFVNINRTYSVGDRSPDGRLIVEYHNIIYIHCDHQYHNLLYIHCDDHEYYNLLYINCDHQYHNIIYIHCDHQYHNLLYIHCDDHEYYNLLYINCDHQCHNLIHIHCDH
ncbi:Glycosyl transferase family 13, partial [Trinorchestia longiramus]